MSSRRSRKLRSIGICAAIAVGASLGVLAPAAMAAPANDALAARTPLAGPLPIEVSESNAGATREEGEFISPFGFAAGHSVWWEWEAPRSEVVSIGACGSDFATKVGVFTGGAFPLQPVEGATTGPECNGQKTFAAVAGTTYEIGVDGESLSIPGSPGPPGVGTIALRIAALPPPPNDAFAAPTAVPQLIWLLPDGSRTMLGSTSGGYNWGATSEPGEPVHAGVGGGASAWYRFIAPGAGTVGVSTTGYEGGGSSVVAVYTGSAVSALTPVAASASWEHLASFHAEAGQEFRIAVDGRAGADGAPWMGDVGVMVTEQLPPGTGNASGARELESSTLLPPGSATAPVARPEPPQVKGHSVDSRGGTASFRFSSAVRDARFRCSLDRGPFRGCKSPLHLRHLHPGAHRLGIVTVLSGHPVSAPSVVHFRIAAAPRRHHAAG